jgi:hypothetical protein
MEHKIQMNQEIINRVLHSVINDGQIKVPTWAKRIKLDIGLSVNAPNSEVWINKNDDLCVFGFEPNPYNISHIHNGEKIWPVHLDPKKIDNSFFIIHCALSDDIIGSQDFFCTENDGGTSSLFEPKYFGIKDKIKIDVITLESFFDLFPWSQIEYIEQVKIDAQSSDFNIIKGMGKYLNERVVYLDVETHTNNQYNNEENPSEIREYLEKNDFTCLSWGINATFINNKLSHHKSKIDYSILGD